MRNKTTRIILVLMVLIVGAFLYRIFFSGDNASSEELGPKAYFVTAGNLTVPFQQPLKTPIKVLPDQQKVEVFINDSLVLSKINPDKSLSIDLSLALPLGAYRIQVISTDINGTSTEDERVLYVVSNLVPENWTISAASTFPHNDSSFTQGLAFYEGKLYEGTGDPKNLGLTMVAEVDLKTGKILRRRTKPVPIFGEGIAVFQDELYQISWKNDSCYVYDASTFTPKRTYNYSGEGWGLTHNGKELIMSDGSEKIFFRDPASFSVTKTISVYTNQGPVTYLNELEYINGLLYANIWMSNLIAVIEPSTGRVLATIDATNLVKQGKGNGEVLNGIAYNPKTKKTYLTGKYWPTMFEVVLQKPSR